MRDTAARRLILMAALLLALFDLIALLPGNPVVTSVPAFAFAVAIQVLLIWGLWRRSSLAWFFWVVPSALFAVALILFLGGWEATLVVTLVLTTMQVALLCTPPVLAYVWRRDEAVTTH